MVVFKPDTILPQINCQIIQQQNMAVKFIKLMSK